MPFYENKSEAMILKTKFLTGFFFISILTLSLSSNIKAEEKYSGKQIYVQIERISKDLKTLEKAFYKTSEVKSSTASFNTLDEDVLTRHLLKLNEIEEQFRESLVAVTNGIIRILQKKHLSDQYISNMKKEIDTYALEEVTNIFSEEGIGFSG